MNVTAVLVLSPSFEPLLPLARINSVVSVSGFHSSRTLPHQLSLRERLFDLLFEKVR